MQSTAKPEPDKRAARKQQRREAILALARSSFLEHGFSGTSMSAIAADLGGSKATLWSYFPSKADLFAAVLEQATSAYRAELSDLLKPTDDLPGTLLIFCRSYIRKIITPEALRLHRLVMAEAERFPEIGDIFYRRAPQMTQGLLADFLSIKMEAGLLRRAEPRPAARALMSLCLGGIHQRMLWGLPASASDEIEAEARFATETFLAAYRPD